MKSRIRRISTAGLIAALCLAAPTLFAQNRLPIQIDVDHSSFAYDEDQSLVELYLAVDAASLDYYEENGAFAARVPLDLVIVRSETADLPGALEDAVWSDSLLLQFTLPDTADLSEGQHFVHQLRTLVPPGEYELRLIVPPNTNTNRQELELRRDVLVPSFTENERTALSDITLASGIVQSDAREHPFYKNGLIVNPNANQLYGQGLPTLYYYAEAYATEEVADSGGEYTLLAYVSEANRPQPMQNLQKRTVRQARTHDVIVGQFDLGALPSGSYFLRVALLNEQNEAVVEQARKFFVYNPSIQRSAPVAMEMEFDTSPYAAMSEDEVDQAVDHALLIANDGERRRMRRTEDLDERRRALMEFWQKRDSQPSTPVNEFKDDFYQRLQYVNDRYSTSRVEGWQTDRGRVVIRYGIPTAVEPHLYDPGMKPYEIWTYNSIPGEGQAMFVFADLTGFGEFELLHSSVTGERTHPNWRGELVQR